MTAAILLQPLCFREFDNNGNPLAFGTVTSYQAGTTTPTPTYTDSTAGTPNANPLTLNARGEAQIWCLPNVSYKFVVQDSTGNQIRSIDNVQQSQVLSLYGGVDSGVADAYVLTFTASFSAYADGIVIYWIPSNSNTSASTINVNGLGVVNIKNPDGSTLQANEIVANQPATILYKGGVFYLLSSAAALYGAFTGSLTGFASPLAPSMSWAKVGNIVVLLALVGAIGTSNSTSMSLTGLPSAITPVISRAVSCASITVEDNGIVGGATYDCNVTSSGIFFYKNANSTGFTATGTKGIIGGWQVVYSLS